MAFLTHFQLPFRYKTGIEILTSLLQSNTTHISDHIHEWKNQRRLIKSQIPNQILADWFTESLLPQISSDVAMGDVVTEDQVISHAQYLNLVYSQLGTLYELIPNTPRPTNDPSRPAPKPHVDGTVGSIKTHSSSTPTGNKNSSTSTPATVSNVSNAKSTPSPDQSSKVNVV